MRVTCRCRLMRLIEEGPVPGTIFTTSSSGADPIFVEGTVICASPSALPAKPLLSANDHVILILARVESGCLLPGYQRVERRFDIHHRNAQVAARGRSISSRTSGLPLRSVVSVSVRLEIVRILASMRSEYFASLSRSGP